MHALYLLRHAKSSWADLAIPDQERPLAPRGQRDGKRIAKHLARLRPALGTTGNTRLEAELYAASSDELLERIRGVAEEVASVMLIGHNPGLQDLALVLASGGVGLERLQAKFPTAALATLTLGNTPWNKLSNADALLAAYVVPK